MRYFPALSVGGDAVSMLFSLLRSSRSGWVTWVSPPGRMQTCGTFTPRSSSAPSSHLLPGFPPHPAALCVAFKRAAAPRLGDFSPCLRGREAAVVCADAAFSPPLPRLRDAFPSPAAEPPVKMLSVVGFPRWLLIRARNAPLPFISSANSCISCPARKHASGAVERLLFIFPNTVLEQQLQPAGFGRSDYDRTNQRASPRRKRWSYGPETGSRCPLVNNVPASVMGFSAADWLWTPFS